MYEKKSKSSKLAPILDKISVRLSEAIDRTINEKYTILL